MPYDMHTPYGIIPGQVSPEEQMQSQNLSRLRGQFMEQEGKEAQMRVLRQSMPSGQGGGDAPYDPYPKTGGMVSGTQPRLQPGEYGTDAYFQNRHRDRAATGVAQGEAELRTQQMQRQQRAGSQLDAMLGIGPAGQAAPAAAPAPARAGAGYESLVGGGQAASPAAAGGGGMDEADLLRTAILGAVASGGAMPDVAGIMNKRAEREAAAPKNAIELETLRAQLAELKAGAGRADRERRFGAGELKPGEAPPMLMRDFLAKNPQVGDSLQRRSTAFGEQDAKTFGWDPDDAAVDEVVRERDSMVQDLSSRGYPPGEALKQANMLVSRSVAGNQGDVNAGWIPKLLQRLGISEAPPEAPPSMMDQFPG